MYLPHRKFRNGVLRGFAAAALLGICTVSAASATSPDGGRIEALAGGGSSTADGVLASTAALDAPAAIELDGNSLLVAASGENRIRRISLTGERRITTIALPGVGALAQPQGIDRTATGFRIADTGNNRIVEYRGGATPTATEALGMSVFTSLSGPTDVASVPGAAADYFVADTANNLVRRVVGTPSFFNQPAVIAGTGSPGIAGETGPGLSAQLNRPAGLAVTPDKAGLLIADSENDRIRYVDLATGRIRTLVGDGSGAGSTGDGGLASAATLDTPTDVELLPGGGYLIAERRGRVVRRVSSLAPDARISTVAGRAGVIGTGGDGGSATAATFTEPISLAVSGDRSFYVADAGADRIRSVELAAAPGPAPPPPTAGGGKGADPKGTVFERGPETSLARGPVAPSAPAASQRPALGRSVVLAPAAGSILVRGPKARRFARLKQSRKLAVGSLVDARRGEVQLTSAADARGRVQTARFSKGIFEIRQRRARNAVTELVMRGALPSCKRPSARTAGRQGRKVRRLWGRGHGRFSTRGRRSAATVTGTIWRVTDRCEGTETRVLRGSVSVEDFARNRRVTVRRGDRYVARPRRR